MMNNRVCELVCTRLSHDVIGNVGAVANAVELLEEGDMDFIDDIKSILKASSFNLSARLKFFRLAFGLDNPTIKDRQAVVETARNYLASIGNKDYPIDLIFDVWNSDCHRTALQLMMVMADIMPRGGILKIVETDNKLRAIIGKETKIAAEKLERISAAIDKKSTGIDASLAPLYSLIETLGAEKICLEHNSDSIVLVVG